MTSAGRYAPSSVGFTFRARLRDGRTRSPGRVEFCAGEVDDVLAAARFLATQPYVDTNRIYLGGHSTGGTLALLVSERRHRLRRQRPGHALRCRCGICLEELQFVPGTAQSSLGRSRMHAALGS